MKCEYCGRHGDGYTCDGCGAPTIPLEANVRIETTTHNSPQRTWMELKELGKACVEVCDPNEIRAHYGLKELR